ncbi:hypothetical protein Tco_0481835 [Tanacetum coccineum]
MNSTFIDVVKDLKTQGVIEIIIFLASLGHTGDIRKLSDVNVNKLHQPWRSAQILWGMYNQKNVDYAYLLWEDFIFKIETKSSKKGSAMYYPRFTKIIVNYVMEKDPRESFDELTDSTFDFSAFVLNRLNVQTITPELLAGPKHINIRYHFIKKHVEKGTIKLYFVGTEYQLADLFTKYLPSERFEYLVHKIGMRCMTPTELDHLAKLSS